MDSYSPTIGWIEVRGQRLRVGLCNAECRHFDSERHECELARDTVMAAPDLGLCIVWVADSLHPQK